MNTFKEKCFHKRKSKYGSTEMHELDNNYKK